MPSYFSQQVRALQLFMALKQMVEKTFCIVSHGYAVYVDVSLYQLV